MTVYVVSSFRGYGDGEQYFSADGVFHTKEEAKSYIHQDINDTMDDYVSLYDDEDIRDQVITEDDTADYKIEYDGHTFMWRIDCYSF